MLARVNLVSHNATLVLVALTLAALAARADQRRTRLVALGTAVTVVVRGLFVVALLRHQGPVDTLANGLTFAEGITCAALAAIAWHLRRPRDIDDGSSNEPAEVTVAGIDD
jgi:heme A synthase